MPRIFFFLLGFGLTVIGCTYWVIYLNLLTIGYSLLEYFTFTFQHVECLFAVIGFMIMTISIFWKGEQKFDLRL